jgi:hypothetical protein
MNATACMKNHQRKSKKAEAANLQLLTAGGKSERTCTTALSEENDPDRIEAVTAAVM